MSSQEFNDDQKAEFAKVQKDVKYARAKFERLAKVYEFLSANGNPMIVGNSSSSDGMSDDNGDDDEDSDDIDDAPGPSKRPSKRRRSQSVARLHKRNGH